MSNLLYEIFKEVLPSEDEGGMVLIRKAGRVAEARMIETLTAIPEDSQATDQRRWLLESMASLASGDFKHDFYFLSEEILESGGILELLQFAGLIVELYAVTLVEVASGGAGE